MTDRKPVRVALAGLGAIAMDAHLPALLRSTDVEVAALVDPDEARRRVAGAALPGTPLFADLAPALADDSISAVVLATPPWVTTGLIRMTLARGLFCLAEKPLGVDTASVRALVDLPVEQRSRLQPGLTYRHDPAMAMLGSWIEKRELGTPLLIRAHIYDERRTDDESDYRRRILASMAHGSPIIHEGAHVLDWLTHLMGAPAEHVTDAWSLRTEDRLPNPNITGARLSWPDGSVALVEVGWWTGAQPRCAIGVLGQVGYAVLDCVTFRLERHTAAGTVVVEFPGDRTSRSFDRQLARFVELVRGDRPTAEPGLDDAVATLELSERIVAAAGDRR